MALRFSFALFSLLFASLPLPAQTLSEYDVEAAYLYNFGKFVRWPADASAASSTFDICVLGDSPFRGTLERLTANDTIDGKPIRKRIISGPSDAAGCAIVYISDSQAANVKKVLADFRGRSQLLVSGIPHFIDDGGAIQFVVKDHRVRFAVNLQAASRSRLVLSSELLKVAVRVAGKPQSGGMP